MEDIGRDIARNVEEGVLDLAGLEHRLGPPGLSGVDVAVLDSVDILNETLGKKHTVILSTHILPEVQAVCNRLLVINEGSIIADRPTEELTRVIRDANRYRLSVEGTQNTVIATLRAVPGVLRVDVLPERDGAAYLYRIESAVGTDVRRAVFLSLAEKKLPLLAFEPISSNLEEVFLQLIENGGVTEQRKKSARRGK